MEIKPQNIFPLSCENNNKRLKISHNYQKLVCNPIDIVKFQPEATLDKLSCCPENINVIEIMNTVEFYDSNLMPNTPTTQILYISNSDIISNKVTLNHQLNNATLDCSVFDENGIEISVGFKLISSSIVELDMTRVIIPNGYTWKVLLEV